MAFKIQFEVTCVTNFGQTAVICGNLPDLGAWDPAHGLRLQTEKKIFPLWRSESGLMVRQGETVELKLCIIDSSGQLVRWQVVGANRSFAPRGPLMVSFADSEATLFCRALRRRVSSQGIGVSNVRKGTEDVINDLASDSSSNREMWREHRPLVQEGSLLLGQFEECLRQAVATQREQVLQSLELQPEMQLQNQLEFAGYNSHPCKTHYFVTGTNLTGLSLNEEIARNQKLVVTSLGEVQTFKLEQKSEVSVFHLLLSDHQDIELAFKQVLQGWYTVSGDDLRGLTVLYVGGTDTERVKPLIGEGLDVLVCADPAATQSIVDYAVGEGLRVKSRNKDEFLLFEGTRFVLKVVVYPFNNALFANELSTTIRNLTPALQRGFFFHYPEKELRKYLKSTLSWIRSAKCHCLLVVQARRLQDLSVKTIGDLIDMTSLKYNAIVVVFVYQRFPRNIQDKVPVVKNRLLIINNEGEIYSNGKEAIDIFDYLEVTKSKFEENCKLITEKIGKGLVSLSSIGAYRVGLQFPRGAFGVVLRERALRCVQDVNRKSLAKIVPELRGDLLVLTPFALQPAFLLKVALATFGQKLRGDEKGLVVSVESEGCGEVRWMEPLEGREVNLQFCRFCLGEEERRRYGSTPLEEKEFHRLLNVVAELENERKKEIEKKPEVLGDVKNII